jgi:hypothetical protein
MDRNNLITIIFFGAICFVIFMGKTRKQITLEKLTGGVTLEMHKNLKKHHKLIKSMKLKLKNTVEKFESKSSIHEKVMSVKDDQLSSKQLDTVPAPSSAPVEEDVIGYAPAPMFAPVGLVENSYAEDLFFMNEINDTVNNSLSFVETVTTKPTEKEKYVAENCV